MSQEPRHPGTRRQSSRQRADGPVRNRIGRSLLRLVLALALGGSCGCQWLSYRGSGGERLTRASLGSATAVSSLAIEFSSNGVRRVELRGYRNDTAQAMGTVTEAAVRAAISAAK